jgi:DNA replication protein DnaC
MLTYFLKRKYPNVDFSDNHECWNETESYSCAVHGEQKCLIDYGMINMADNACSEVRLQDGYCPVCKQEEADRIEQKRQRIESERLEKERIARQRGVRKRDMKTPPRFADTSFDNFIAKTPKQKAALKACQAFAENFKTMGKAKGGLIMLGNVGTGKTHLSIAIGHALLNQDLSVTYTTIGRLIRKVRNSWSDKEITEQGLYNAFAKYELLIIDELGIQNGTENEKNILFEVINARYEEQKPTILVSNLNPADMINLVGQRITDRIGEGGGNRIVFDWASYRQRAA